MPGEFMGFETSSDTLEKCVDAAIQHAEIHWKKLLTSKTFRITQDDHSLHVGFRKYFPSHSTKKITRQLFEGTNKSKWKRLEREYMKSSSYKQDTLTMLRIDSRGAYTKSNSIMVSRFQFLCVEATRNCENEQNIDPKGILVDDLRSRKKSIMISFHNKDVRELVKWITQLRISYPCPDRELLSRSGIAKCLTRIKKTISKREVHDFEDGDEDILKAVDTLLSQWRVVIALQKFNTALTKRILSRLSGCAVTVSSLTKNEECATKIHDDDIIQSLLLWADENGASFVTSRIGIIENEEKIRGLGTLSAVKAGEELYRIPLSLALTLDVAIRSDIGHICKRIAYEKDILRTDEGVSLDESGSRFALALLIAHEKVKGKSSFYAPWIRSLPQSYDCLAMWTHSELSMLKCPELEQSARRSNILLRQVWKQISNLILREDKTSSSSSSKLQDLDFETFRWGYLTIESRALSFGRQGRQRHPFGNSKHISTSREDTNLDDQIAVVPVFDLMNHESALLRSSPIFRFESPKSLSYPSPEGYEVPIHKDVELPKERYATFREALSASSSCHDMSFASKYDPQHFQGLNEERFGKAPAQCVSCHRWSSVEESANDDLWIFESFYCLRCTSKENKESIDVTDWLPSDLSIVATRDYSRGEQITFPYGKRLPSQELLIRYGFLPSSSSQETVLMLELPAKVCATICRNIHHHSSEHHPRVDFDCKELERLIRESRKRQENRNDKSALSVPPVRINLENRMFWASRRWIGSRRGYYFGSGDFGVGYYADSKESKRAPLLEHVFPGDMKCFLLHPLPYGVGEGWSKSAMPYFRSLASDEITALKLLKTYLETRLDMLDDDDDDDDDETVDTSSFSSSSSSSSSYRENLAMRFRAEQKSMIESHLKCLNLSLQLMLMPDVSFNATEYEKYDLDHDTLAEVILYVLRYSSNISNRALRSLPQWSEDSMVSCDDGLFVVEGVLGVVNNNS